MRVSSERMDRVMGEIHPHFTGRATVSFLLLFLLQTSTEANICSAPFTLNFEENNPVGAVVVEITVQPGVSLQFAPPPANPDNPFTLDGNLLKAARVLDYEAVTSYQVEILCDAMLPLTIIVLLTNVNDNPPAFAQNPYNKSINEMEPVGTTVGRFDATDLDRPSQLFYTLTSKTSNNNFALVSRTNPSIIIQSALDYDTVNNVQLVLEVQDTQDNIVFTATTIINISILDGDNRPPWFQPCTRHELGGTVVCQNTGYTGRVDLNEHMTGVLPLKPGPLYAIDGDSGINEAITYSFVGGSGGDLFSINSNTGNITMLKPTDVLRTISLTVLAAQRTNSYQFATTSVTISVQVKSEHPPKFQKDQYEGIVSSVGAMVMDPNNNDEPLRIIAYDKDYASVGNVNPYINYYVNGSSDFTIIDGYLFMIKEVPEDTLSLKVVAKDTTNDESATAQVVVVTTGLTTTSLPLSTEESTTDVVSTIVPSKSTDSSISTAAESHYGPADMGALGGTLGVLLFICVVIIGVLAHRIHREKRDWRRIFETTKFQSSLHGGSSGNKECIQYTNEAFQEDEDGGSAGGGSVMAGGEPALSAYQNFLLRSPSAVQDDASVTGSDDKDDKEVKPILTKEKRTEEGYKSVWFKEDIDPNAKEEVVIIPDSREDDSEEEDEDNYEPVTIPKVGFSETDLDSGLGVKIGDPAEDSEDNEMVNIDL